MKKTGVTLLSSLLILTSCMGNKEQEVKTETLQATSVEETTEENTEETEKKEIPTKNFDVALSSDYQELFRKYLTHHSINHYKYLEELAKVQKGISTVAANLSGKSKNGNESVNLKLSSNYEGNVIKSLQTLAGEIKYACQECKTGNGSYIIKLTGDLVNELNTQSLLLKSVSKISTPNFKAPDVAIFEMIYNNLKSLEGKDLSSESLANDMLKESTALDENDPEVKALLEEQREAKMITDLSNLITRVILDKELFDTYIVKGDHLQGTELAEGEMGELLDGENKEFKIGYRVTLDKEKLLESIKQLEEKLKRDYSDIKTLVGNIDLNDKVSITMLLDQKDFTYMKMRVEANGANSNKALLVYKTEGKDTLFTGNISIGGQSTKSFEFKNTSEDVGLYDSLLTVTDGTTNTIIANIEFKGDLNPKSFKIDKVKFKILPDGNDKNTIVQGDYSGVTKKLNAEVLEKSVMQTKVTGDFSSKDNLTLVVTGPDELKPYFSGSMGLNTHNTVTKLKVELSNGVKLDLNSIGQKQNEKEVEMKGTLQLAKGLQDITVKGILSDEKINLSFVDQKNTLGIPDKTNISGSLTVTKKIDEVKETKTEGIGSL